MTTNATRKKWRMTVDTAISLTSVLGGGKSFGKQEKNIFRDHC